MTSDQAGARVASADDVDDLALVLARAFADDPVMSWMLGDGSTVATARAQRFFAMDARNYLAYGHCYVTEPRGGASLWAPPGKWRTPPLAVARALRMLMATVPLRIPTILRTLLAIEAVHPDEDHYYLAVLGTDPANRGQGLGNAAMQPCLDLADSEGVGCYLESSKESNIPYYERAGFRVTGEVTLPKGGPPVWSMWRAPQG